MLTMSGQLQGIRTSTYQGQAKQYLQFLEKKADGSLGFTEVKVSDGIDPAQFKVGSNVSVPVEYKQVRDKIFWAIDTEALKTGTQKPA